MEQRFDWTSMLIGVLMIIVGILILTNPAATMTTLAIFVGVAVLVSGVIFLFKYKESTANLIYGIIAIILGIILLARPAFAVSALGFIIGIWFFIDGVLGLTRAGFYKLISSTLYITSIILNVLLLIAGFLIILNPFIAALSLPMMTGIALLVAGVMHVVGAFGSKQQPPSLPY